MEKGFLFILWNYSQYHILFLLEGMQIKKAFQETQQSTDPEIRAKWALIPRKGSHLTLEEFLDYAGKYLARF